jgi:death-on-curing protein
VSRTEPRWLGRLVVDEAHFRQIQEHGGSYGLRDEHGLGASLARPQQRWQYDEDASLADLAASLAFGLVQSHPYVDGNKRVGLVALVAFLDLNGVELKATNAEAATAILSVAAGEMREAELAKWIEAHS